MDSAKKKLAVMKARLTESLMEAERAETELAEKRKKAEQVKIKEDEEFLELL